VDAEQATDSLVTRYAEAASRHGEVTLAGTETRIEDADEIASVYAELRRRDGRSALLPLLDADEPGVRVWAAAHALEFAPDKGEVVLVQLSQREDVIGFTAATTLDEWRAGRLWFP
jgi:hypothetical protein